MVKLSAIINPIYREYTPLLRRIGLILDLDLKNPTTPVNDPDALQFELKKYLDLALTPDKDLAGALRSTPGRIVISDQPAHCLSVKDTSLVISPTQRQALTSKSTSVKSRLGFGTTFTISIS